MLYRFKRKDDLEMLQSFIEESEENLQKIEENALCLETTEETAELLDDIFRRVHTIKGLSAFFGLSEFTNLSHITETMLNAIRKGELLISADIVSLLLESVDELGSLIGQIHQAVDHLDNNPGIEIELIPSERYDRLRTRLEAVVEEKREKQGDVKDSAPEPKAGADDPRVNSGAVELAEHEELVNSSLLEDFLLEADEHVIVLTNQVLIEMEDKSVEEPQYGELFRRVHTIKGNIGLLLSVPTRESGLRQILLDSHSLVQNLEELLQASSNRGLAVSGEIVDSCFAVMDALSAVLSTLREKNFENRFDFVELTERLKRTKETLPEGNGLNEGQALPENSEERPLSEEGRDGASENTTSRAKKNSRGAGSSPGFGRSSSPGVGRSSSIRVSEEKINHMMNAIGELVVSRNIFAQIARRLTMEYGLPEVARELKEAGLWITRISEELEAAIMSMRMNQVQIVFQKFPRIIHDIAVQSGKKIALITEGEDTELDKSVLEQVADPLMHLVRNAADHGIESVERRNQAGKPDQGTVWLRAYNRGNFVYIEVEDDGAGIDPEKIKAKAIQKGFITEEKARAMSKQELLQLIFLPGFSTAEKVSEISGRGVGMDVVRNNIAALRGSVDVLSEPGKGTKFVLQLPLTLLISKGLLTEVADRLFVFPLDNVVETLKVSAKELVIRRGKRMLHHRGEVLGIEALTELFNMGEPVLSERTPIVVVTDGYHRLGIIVDRLVSEQDVLVKPLPDFLAGIQGMGGGTQGNVKVLVIRFSFCGKKAIASESK